MHGSLEPAHTPLHTHRWKRAPVEFELMQPSGHQRPANCISAPTIASKNSRLPNVEI